MIRVYSSNFRSEDYLHIAQILSVGLNQSCVDESNENCFSCSQHHVCKAVSDVINYCNKKAAEMVEP